MRKPRCILRRYTCPDGTDGLTRELYETGDPSKYANVTCIPKEEFKGYTGDVTLDRGMPYLERIGLKAFDTFKGKLVLSGAGVNMAMRVVEGGQG